MVVIDHECHEQTTLGSSRPFDPCQLVQLTRFSDQLRRGVAQDTRHLCLHATKHPPRQNPRPLTEAEPKEKYPWLVRQTLHPVAYSTELGTSPLSVRLLGEPLVIWRDSTGTAHATSDVCVHRGTALSGGCVKGDTIMCPYHGWQFDETGKCTHIPQLEDPTKVPSKAQIAAHHCVEQYNIIWVSLDEPRRPLPSIEDIFV